MNKSTFLIGFLCASMFISCSEDDVKDALDETLSAGDNEVVFSDDNTPCEPFSDNITISDQGILSVVMKPCQNSGSKLDGYFKYGSRPVAGTYTVVGEAGTFPNPVNIGETEFSMLFYGHASETLYATSGTVVLTANADDDTRLDMTWSDMTMETSDGTSLKFSGSFKGL